MYAFKTFVLNPWAFVLTWASKTTFCPLFSKILQFLKWGILFKKGLATWPTFVPPTCHCLHLVISGLCSLWLKINSGRWLKLPLSDFYQYLTSFDDHLEDGGIRLAIVCCGGDWEGRSPMVRAKVRIKDPDQQVVQCPVPEGVGPPRGAKTVYQKCRSRLTPPTEEASPRPHPPSVEVRLWEPYFWWLCGGNSP